MGPLRLQDMSLFEGAQLHLANQNLLAASAFQTHQMQSKTCKQEGLLLRASSQTRLPKSGHRCFLKQPYLKTPLPSTLERENSLILTYRR